MRPRPHAPISLALAAGAVSPAIAQPRFVEGMPVAQIRIDLATGQRTVHEFGRSAGLESNPVWRNANIDGCLAGVVVGVIDDVDTDGDGRGDLFGGACVGGTFPCEGTWNNWWGDLNHPDTVINRIHFMYGVGVPDVDLDSDGVGDGVEGLNLYLNFADNDNGFGMHEPGSSRSCIIELEITDLPGDIGNLPPGQIPVYELVIDLANDSPSLVFELGDSDAIDDAGTGYSGAAIYGHPTYSDRDGFGGHDFSYGIRFDMSSIPQSQRGITGFVGAFPWLNNPGDTPPHPSNAQGLFDATDIYASGPVCDSNVQEDRYIGTFFFGGWTCPWPYQASHIELYGTPGEPSCTVADLAEPYGALDFSDVAAFLQAVATGGELAEQITHPFNAFDFADVLTFLEYYAQGCW